MINIAYSVNNLPIRLTGERWIHVVENHDDIAGYYFDVLETITNPKWIFEGDEDELWAVKLISEQNEGFIITAFFTTKIRKLLRRKMIWQRLQQ